MTFRENLISAIVFDARDWSINQTDAWIYGIVVGWDSGFGEVADRHKWSNDAQKRLKKFHRQFRKLGEEPTA